MGRYDYVTVPCPSCGTTSEFQSKSGPCNFVTYSLDEAPAEVLDDVNRHSPNRCEKCGTLYGVKVEIITRPVSKGTPIIWPSPKEDEEE